MSRQRIGVKGPYAGQIKDMRSVFPGREITNVIKTSNRNGVVFRNAPGGAIGTTTKSKLVVRPHRGIASLGRQASDLKSPAN